MDLQRDRSDGPSRDPQLFDADLDAQMEHRIGTELRCAKHRALVHAQCEGALLPRVELFTDTVRLCAKLKDAIDEMMGLL